MTKLGKYGPLSPVSCREFHYQRSLPGGYAWAIYAGNRVRVTYGHTPFRLLKARMLFTLKSLLTVIDCCGAQRRKFI
jgi:hypothetical protein